jgi:gas vesicle protein
VSEQSRVMSAAVLGAICGAAVGYLFFTDQGKELRDRCEPAIDDLRREFAKFQGTIEKVGVLANDGMRVMEEFKTARGAFASRTTSH